MNIVRELRKKKGIQQKELALEIGVSNAAVSDWENGKKDPTGERLEKLAEYFGVDKDFILGYGMKNPSLFVPEDPKLSGMSETEQVVNYVLEKLGVNPSQNASVTKSRESQIISECVDKMPPAERKRALDIFKAAFSEYIGEEEKIS